MLILGIETSCDETSAAILEQKDGRIQILSNVVASSALLQSKYVGIIPEQAAREQLKSIVPVITEALTQAIQQSSYKEKKIISLDSFIAASIDAIAVTYGPGLIGSLLVGVETVKVLSLLWNKPLIPVNHLLGHFYANWIGVESRIKSQESSKDKSRLSTLATRDLPEFPCIGLLVSGGHTDLVLFKNHGQYEYLGGTRDDAAGECFDKCARLLNLPYPGGPEISKLARSGNPMAFDLPRPMIDSKDFDFSFSGLKTAVYNLMKSDKIRKSVNQNVRIINTLTHRSTDTLISSDLSDLCASIEAAIIETLVKKTVEAAKCYKVEQIIVAGGVAANQKLVSTLRQTINDERLTINISIPQPSLCTDNAAMIAAAAFFCKPRPKAENLQANPNLSLAY